MMLDEDVMPNYKLIALDLDGTLLTDEKQISEESKKWLRYAEDRGVIVMFSTGRGIQTAKSFWNELELDSPMIFLNGAEIWEAPGKLLKRTFLPRSTVRQLYDIATAHDVWFWGYSVESVTSGKDWTAQMFERDWMKFGIGSDHAETIEQIEKVIELWGTLEITRTAPTNMEISVKGVTKESGMQEICRLLGITMSDVMAVGDSDNDLSLLKAAGLGVVMDNAGNHIKFIADAVTASNNEEGVASAIRKYVFQLE